MPVIPEKIEYILKTLVLGGFEAYLVGGCVRDMLSGKAPHDFDITTSARPEEVIKIFPKTVPTGIKHGTVTVLHGGISAEVTTFRADGEYKDSRHPESIRFVGSLKEDLARRDFTVNAMAYNPKEGVKDFFGGREDLENKVLRAVGDPEARFKEDALRILRLFRFASALGFSPEKNTLEAALGCAPLLTKISAERISAELLKALCGADPAALAPLTNCGGLEFLGVHGRPDYHKVKLLNANADLALFAFLYSAGANIPQVLKRLKLPNKTKSFAAGLLPLLEMPVCETKYAVKEALFRYSPELFGSYLQIRNVFFGDDTSRAATLLSEILANGEPYRICDLKISGKELIKLGISGERIGETLEALRRSVSADPRLNTEELLLKKAEELNRN